MSLREISSTTKISLSALEALERNDVSRLPGGIFTRAFVRSFASEVGLDPEQTLREFLDEFPLDGVADGSPHATDTQEHQALESQRQMAGTLIRLVALSIPLAGVILYLTVRNGTPVADAPAPDVAPAVSGAVARDDAGPPVEPGADAEAAGPEGPVSKTMTIGIHPEAPCWVSLTTDGELVFSRVMQPGEHEVAEALEEIVLSIGDAGAFAFTLNERPGRRLGGAGEVVTARINQDNYQDYLAR